MKNIFITTSTFGEFSNKPVKLLEKNGFNITYNKTSRKLTTSELQDLIHKFDGIIAGTEEYNSEILMKAKKLKIISRVGVGIDNIDLSYTQNNNISVYKTKISPAPAVAELVIYFIINSFRKLSFQSNNLKDKNWGKKMGSLFQGKTLGIIGLGTIGKSLVKLTKGFNLEYLASDLYEDKEFSKIYNVKYCKISELLEKSDIVTIHLNLTQENQGLINLSKLKKMKKTAIIINTSRGEIVCEDDLEIAIKDKIISGAGLDVFSEEPYEGSLLNHENILTTPHIGSYAKEIRIKMELESVENLIEGFRKDG